MTSVAQRLRQKLLDLAIHGKLVPQNQKDEPAGELLARIRKARGDTEGGTRFRASERAGVGGRMRTRRSASLPIPEEEIPFDLPRGWAWCRLGEVCDVLAGFPFDSKKYVETGIKICGGLIIMPDKIKWHECKHWPDSSGYEAYLLQKNDVVVALDRPWITDGFKVGIVKDSDLPALLIQRTARLRSDYVEADYLVSLLSSDRFRLFCDPTGTTVPHISHTDILNFPIPLPPPAEQKRIVEKLNAMLKEATQVAEGTERLALLRKKARAKILDLAIRGKLVKQEKSDEPASELLKRIAAQKAKLVAEKKIKKEKPLPPIADDEIPFDLPKGWTWCRLAEIAYVAAGKTPAKTEFVEDGVPYIKMYNLRCQKIDFAFRKQFIKRETHEGQLVKSRLRPGDLLMNIVGPPLGKLAIIPDSISEANFNQAAVMIRPHVEVGIINQYLYYYLWQMDEINSIDTKGTAGQDNISITQAMMMRIALPPLGEQRRIVAKVKEMLAACDALSPQSC